MLKAVYLGTPDFAVAPLKELLKNKDLVEVIAVVTNNDKPVGRKQVITPCPVKVEALKNNIPVYQYDKIRIEGVDDLKALSPDIMITCAFGQILSQEILDIAPKGTINVHASLLPKYRGASPIHYAILNGEKTTGVSIMRTDIGIDTGDVILQKEIQIGEEETCGELFERLSLLGAESLIEALKQISNGTAEFVKQDDNFATFSKIIKKADAKICWNSTSNDIVNFVRAYNPAPVAFTLLDEMPLKIFKVRASKGKGLPGEILENDKDFEVATKDGSVIIERLQKAGGKEMNARDFLKGYKLQKGKILG